MLSTLNTSVAILGVPFNNVTMDEAVSIIEEKIIAGGFHQVATANVDFVNHAIHDKEMHDILCSCDLIVPDGMPIVWASRLMGTKLKERVSGVDLVPRLAELSAQRGYGIYLLGASEKSSKRAAEVLEEQHPGVRIVGRYSPPLRPLEEMDHEDILERIRQAQPDILLVAMGNPKQERWLAMHRDLLDVPVCIGIGGSLDMIAGYISRAPLWMQRYGLEWLYRICQEPKRLAQRYVNDAMTLAVYLPAQLAMNALQPSQLSPSNIHVDSFENATILKIVGNLAGALCARFEENLRDALIAGRHIVVDMAECSHVGPEALGSLAQLAPSMKRLKQQLWIAQMRPHVVRLMQTSRLEGHFMVTSSLSDALYRIAKADHRAFRPLLAPQRFARVGKKAVQVRVELLLDICNTMKAVNEEVQPDFDSSFTPDATYGLAASVG